jgi:tetratricopeptide (TPR) repeat protein
MSRHIPMPNRKIAVVISIALPVYFFFSRAWAETSADSAFSSAELKGSSRAATALDNLSSLQQQARVYRSQGLEAQAAGNLDSAMVLYQKSVDLDPLYVDAYNDLGIIYEAKGYNDRAEEAYLKAIKIDPVYLSSYTNLALLYENSRDLDKAAFYWQKRAELGLSNDPWTIKARQRLEDIRLATSDRPLQAIKEREVVGLANSVSIEKFIMKRDNKELARYYFKNAKSEYEKGYEVSALKKAIDASQLDPSNSEINEFIEKVQTRLLSQ